MRERNERESCNKLLFSASSQLMSLGEKNKNSFIHEAVLETSVWQKKKPLTTAPETFVRYLI
jgi:hypothetical protein